MAGASRQTPSLERRKAQNGGRACAPVVCIFPPLLSLSHTLMPTFTQTHARAHTRTHTHAQAILFSGSEESESTKTVLFLFSFFFLNQESFKKNSIMQGNWRKMTPTQWSPQTQPFLS